jgi:hypothetical protein
MSFMRRVPQALRHECAARRAATRPNCCGEDAGDLILQSLMNVIFGRA